MSQNTGPFFPDLLPQIVAPGLSDQPSGIANPRVPRNRIRWLKLSLAAAIGGGRAGPGQEFPIKGTGFKCILSEGGNGIVEAALDDGDFGPYVQGVGFNPTGFDSIRIRSDLQAGVTLWFAYWSEHPDAPIQK